MCELRADWWSPGGGAESPEGDNLYACPAGAGLVVAFGVAESPEGDGPYGSPPGPYFSMKKSRQKSLGECPETPDASVHPARKAKGRLPGAGLDDAYKVPQAHFYVGTADRVPLPRCGEGGLYQQSLHKNAPAAPYKRRRVGCNLRLSRADPALCSGQPSPLRCILLSPQGLTTLRGPRLYGVYRRVGVSGSSPSDFWLLFFIEKYPPPGRRTNEYLL